MSLKNRIICLETCKSYKQTCAMHSFVDRICKSLWKYFCHAIGGQDLHILFTTYIPQYRQQYNTQFQASLFTLARLGTYTGYIT